MWIPGRTLVTYGFWACHAAVSPGASHANDRKIEDNSAHAFLDDVLSHGAPTQVPAAAGFMPVPTQLSNSHSPPNGALPLCDINFASHVVWHGHHTMVHAIYLRRKLRVCRSGLDERRLAFEPQTLRSSNAAVIRKLALQLKQTPRQPASEVCVSRHRTKHVI